MKHRLTFFVLLAMTASRSFGGLGTLTGKEARLWTDGHVSVIIATVADVAKGQGEGYQPHNVRLIPKGTLAGTFDSSLHPSLNVRVYVSDLTSSVNVAPRSGTTVLAVIETDALQGEETRPSNWIRSDICTFMPDKSALVIIKSMDDPRVAETLKRLQDARAHPNPDPNVIRPTEKAGNGKPKD